MSGSDRLEQLRRDLAGHELVVVVDVPALQSYRLQAPGIRDLCVQVTCTQEGISIQGDLTPQPNGCCSTYGYGPAWFANGGRAKSRGYLASKFLPKGWHAELAAEELRRELHTGDDWAVAHAVEVRELAERLAAGDYGFVGLWLDLVELEYDLSDGAPGYGPDPSDLDILCAIQETFARLYLGVAWGAKVPRRRRVDAAIQDLRKSARLAGRTGERRRVFIASVADVWDQHPDLVEPRARFLGELQAMGPDCGLIPLLLTKRAKEQAEWAAEYGWPDWWVPMVTVEDQRRADERIPHLLSIEADVRGLSCEPLLSPVDVEGFLPPFVNRLDSLGWVIAGGESGPGARPMHPDWARSLRDQCLGVVPFLFKQWGAWGELGPEDGPDCVIDRAGRVVQPWTAEGMPTGASSADGWQRLYRVGKHEAGRLLDGVEHNGRPW